MQPGEGDVHHGVIEQHGTKTDNCQDGGSGTPPPSGGACVNVSGKKDPDDERPHLFGVPTPVATPGSLRPDGASNEGEAPEHKANNVQPVGKLLQDAGRGKRVHQPRTRHLA